MIDDKKIEEAATVASISNTDKGRVREGYVISALADHENGFREGYIEGVKWAITEFLKGSWHSIEEKPEKEKTFLYQTSFGGFGLNQISDKKDWNFIKKYQKATQWLYVEDLLQKEGDNHD